MTCAIRIWRDREGGGECKMEWPGDSLTFPAGRQLFFIGGQKYQNWTSL